MKFVLPIIAAVISVLLLRPSPDTLILSSPDGEVFGSFDVSDGSRFSVTFVHSVNNTPVTEIYELTGGKIYAVETVYYGFGAGVLSELPDNAELVYAPDGAMVVSGFDRVYLPELVYIVGSVSDHVLEIDGTEISLTELCGKSAAVRFEYR